MRDIRSLLSVVAIRITAKLSVHGGNSQLTCGRELVGSYTGTAVAESCQKGERTETADLHSSPS